MPPKFRIVIENAVGGEPISVVLTESFKLVTDPDGVTRLTAPDEPKLSDSLDATPLGTAAEERQRAKNWMEDAARAERNEFYWREHRAYPAEECVRLLTDGCQIEMLSPKLGPLVEYILSWARPENPEQYHKVPTADRNIGLDSGGNPRLEVPTSNQQLQAVLATLPLSSSSKPFAQQKFSVVQEFPATFKELPIDQTKIAAAQVKVTVGEPLHDVVKSPINPVLNRARELIQSWLDKQGHNKCWYYPEIFRQLAALFGITEGIGNLPPLSEFQGGCRRYQADIYPHDKHDSDAVITDADVLKLIEHWRGLNYQCNGEFGTDPSMAALIAKMEAAIAENAKVSKPLLKTYTELHTAWQNNELPLSDIGLLFVAAHREDKVLSVQVGLTVEVTEEGFSSLMARGEESSFQPEIIGGLVAAAIREDKGLKIEVRGGRVLAWQYTFTASVRKAGPRHSVVVAKERLDQLERAEDNLRVLKEHETHSRPMSFAELLDVHQCGAASLQHIGYLFLAAMREDKCFAIKMGSSVEITETGEPALKIVQGANGDYFVQHKSGLWRIERNGIIGEGALAAESFKKVLKELNTPAGAADPDIVILSKARFDEYVSDSDHLAALHAAGVDNWGGYVGPGDLGTDE